jgi:alpha-2-macroglobulin
MRALLRTIAVFIVVFGAHATPSVSAPVRFIFDGAGATFTPNAPVRVALRSNAPGNVDVAAFALTPDEVLEHRDLAPFITGRGRRPVATARVRIDTTVADAATRVDLGPLPRGLYAIRLRLPNLTRVVYANVTTLGVLTAPTRTGIAASAFDLTTMHVRDDVTFSVYRGNDAAPQAVHAGTSGVALVDGANDAAAGNGNTIVARGSDGSFSILRIPRAYASGGRENGYVQLDRPLYRPGHHVLYRAIVRSGGAGNYSVPSGERTVKLTDPSGKVTSTARRSLDEFGTLSGELALDDDARLGTYTLVVGDDDAGSIGTNFTVAAYKKPEFVLDVTPPKRAIGGEPARFGVAARYFFGRPAAGLKLHYRAYFSSGYAWWRRGSPFAFSGYAPSYDAVLPAVAGDAVADAAGHATIVIPTARVRAEQVLNLEVDGRDDAGRTVTAPARAQVTPSSFFLTVEPGTYFVAAGDEAVLTIRSRSYANAPRPRTPVTLTFARRYYDGRESRRDELRADETTVVTGDDGVAVVRKRFSAAGSIEITAHAADERSRPAETTAYLWVAAKRYERAYAFDRVTVVPQKSEYRPGERASLLVTVPHGDADALVEVTTPSSDTVFVRRLASEVSTIDVDPPLGVARYRVTVTVPSRNGPVTASASLAVGPSPYRLTVEVRPDRTRYAPGERARFALRAADANGKPVRAQIGLAVVDDALLALSEPQRVDLFEVFYGSNGPYRYVTASWSALDAPANVWLYQRLFQTIGNVRSAANTSLIRPGQTYDVYSIGTPQVAGAGPGPSFDALRSDFRDTAFWSPSVVTGADGRAVVTFAWPDSLTSYTASGLAATAGVAFGNAKGTALVSKDFLVRLATPRFMRSGDAARFTAIAHGTPSAKNALLRFSAPEIGVADDTLRVQFDRHASATAGWDVHANAVGPVSLRLAGTSERLRDGLRMTLPVESAGTAEHDRAAGMLPGETSLALRVPRGEEAGDLRIDLAPSLVAQLLAGVRLLQVYPYACTEQTMSAALPAIYVERLRKRAQLPAPDGPPPALVARKAVERLVQLQHRDGSWGWWEHDDPNPFMTAYAMYGLTELARDGYDVPAYAIDAGVKSLRTQIVLPDETLRPWGGTSSGSEWNTRAYMLFALAGANQAAVDTAVLAQADARTKTLNAYALAVLGLAHVKLGDRDGAKPLLDELLHRAVDDGAFTSWKSDGWRDRWMDDPIETTAYALRFVVAMAPDDPHVPRIVNWLRAQQHGSWFATTKDTAAAIDAMSETIAPESNEFTPHETVRVLLDGRAVATVRIDSAVLPRAGASIAIPAKRLRSGGTLRFERTGTGALYWSTDWTRYVRDPVQDATASPFRIRRLFSSPAGNDWHVGDLIDVDTTITAENDTQYVAIEDPLPAGLEYQARQHETGDGWSGLQFFDDRVVFFATRLSARAPLHLHYQLRATTAGTFTAPAPTAYAMYGPPTTSAGQKSRITIR